MHTLSDIAAALDVPAPAGAADLRISGLATLADARAGELSFLGAERYLPALTRTAATAVIVQRKVPLPPDVRPAVLLVDNADLAMARVLALFAPPVPRPPVGVHHTAVVSPHASLGPGVRVGPHVVVGDNARVGRDTVLHAGVYVGANTAVGDDCELFPNVVVRERCTLGDRVVVHAGSVIGSDGFGYRWDGRQHVKVPQIGTVVVEDDVEIGSCSCVDRAKFSATVVGRGTKLDNLVQVGHNVRVGPHCVIAGQAGVAGSTDLGAGVVIGGQAAVRDHLSIGDGVQIGGTAGVADDVPAGQSVQGIPALPRRQWLREQAALRRLPELIVQVRKLQEEVAALRGQQAEGK